MAETMIDAVLTTFLLGVSSSIIASTINKMITPPKWYSELNNIAKDFRGKMGGERFEDLFFTDFDSDGFSSRDAILEKIKNSIIPTKELLQAGLFDRWRHVRDKIDENERAKFFNLTEPDAKAQLSELSERIYTTLVNAPEFCRDADRILHEEILYEIKKVNPSIIDGIIANSEENEDVLTKIFPGAKIAITQLSIQPNFEVVDVYDPKSYAGSSDIVSTISNVLYSQNILFLLGGYGLGKSFLLKLFTQQAKKNGSKVVFYTGRNWERKFNYDLEKLRVELKDIDYKLYLVIDSIEDCIDISAKNDEKNSWMSVCGRLTLISTYENVKILISMRNILGDIENTCTYFTDLYYVDYPENDIKYLQLKPFTSKMRDEWINKYLSELPYEIEPDTINSFLKDKGVKRASTNPLTLYVLLEKMSGENFDERETDAYDYYHYFVGKTVKGKFSSESKIGAYFLSRNELLNDYRHFLRKTAIQIFNHADNQRQLLSLKSTHNGAWPVDPNNSTFTVPYKEVKEACMSFIEKIKDKDKRTRLNALLSCYFFELSEEVVRFKDNNVLHYFLCEAFFEELISISNDIDRNSGAANIPTANLPLLSGIGIEFLMSRIKSLDEDTASKLKYVIAKYIIERFYEKSQGLEIVEMSKRSTSLDIVFYVLAIRLNCLKYPYLCDPLKPLSILLKFDSFFSMGLKSLLYRNFSHCTFYSAEIFGVDLTNINFSNSKFTNTTFRNCRFRKTTFNGVEAKDLKFVSCDFKDIVFEGIVGTIELKDISLLNVTFNKTSQLKLSVLGGRIQDISFNNSGYSSLERDKVRDTGGNMGCIKFAKCILQDTKFRKIYLYNMHKNYVSFNECIIGKFVVRHSDILIKITNSFSSGGDKITSLSDGVFSGIISPSRVDLRI